MNLVDAGILAGAVTLATTAQLLLKAGMTRVGQLSLTDGVWSVVANVLSTWQVVLGFGLFGLSSLFWLAALSRLPLSTAYPIVSMSYVLILLFSVLILHERPTLTVWAGALLIMVGVALIGIGQR